MSKKKADSKAAGSKAVKSEKKKNGKRKFFKDLKSEMKKVVWPSRKQVLNNTAIVMVIMIAMGLFLFGIDTGLGSGMGQLFELFKVKG